MHLLSFVDVVQPCCACTALVLPLCLFSLLVCGVLDFACVLHAEREIRFVVLMLSVFTFFGFCCVRAALSAER